MLLTDAQLHEIRQIIADHHSAFVVNTISSDAVSPEILEKLKEKGLVDPKINSAKDSYLFGVVLASTEDPKVANMTYDQFKAYIQKNPVPLSAIEKRAIEMAQHRAGQYAVGLGRRIDVQTGETLIENDQMLATRMVHEIQTATAENVAKRETVKKLKSDLGWATKDWTRDWDRIAVTEKQNAMQSGVANHYKKEFGDDVRVAKRSMPDACKHCLRVYLGPDGHPRIFKLSDLEKNGTNFGKKANDWLAVVKSTHTWCQCQMIRIPAGWGFNEEGDLEPGAKGGVKYESPEELERSMQEEDELQKAFKIQQHLTYQGIPIAIENRKNSIRKWKDAEGNTGQTKMLHAYGYVKRTEGMDGDEIDVYVGPDPKAPMAYVIEQQNPNTGIYDEQKTMLGFSDMHTAVAEYQKHFNRIDFAVTVNPMEIDQFKRWVANTKPKKGETIKKSSPEIAHVIPLKKSLTTSGSIAKEFATQHSPAGARAPGPNTGANYYFKTPPRTPPMTMKDMGFEKTPAREVLEESARKRKPVKKKKEDYDFDKPLERTIHKFVIPDDWGGVDMLGTGEAEENKKKLKKEGMKNIRRPQNKAEVGK